MLEDGRVFRGQGFGAPGVTTLGEVVFNTALSGYQESLTDPSYAGQILVETMPMIGNTGVNPTDVESSRVRVAGLVVRELAQRHSNARACQSLDAYLRSQGVLGIAGVDTRAITLAIREAGAMRAGICDDPAVGDRELLARVRGSAGMVGANLVPTVARGDAAEWSEDLGVWAPLGTGHADRADAAPLRVAALDCGVKDMILRQLVQRGCEVRVVPYTTTARWIIERIEAGELDGLFVSNGPGDPAAVEATIAMLGEVLGPDAPVRVPTFGICLGHQLIALALGGRTSKLRFGHRGTNQPVLEADTGRVSITSQNHGFAVDPESVEAMGAVATHVHLNDGTLSGFRVVDRPIMAVQHHPEASPGPHDADELFDAFVAMMRAERGRRCGSGVAAGP